MQKVAVLAFRPLREQVLDALQAEGMLHISEEEPSASVDHSEVNYRIAELHFAIDTLKQVSSKKTLASALGKHGVDEILAARSKVDVRGIVDELHALEEKDTAASAVLKEADSLSQILEPWKKLPYRLDLERKTARTVLMLGMVPKDTFFNFQASLRQKLPRTAVEQVDFLGEKVVADAIVWSEDLGQFEEIAASHGWLECTLPHLHGTPNALLRKAKGDAETAMAARLKHADRRVALTTLLPDLIRISIYMDWLNGKQHAREHLSESRSLSTLVGWMPKKDVRELASRLQKISPAIAVEPALPHESEEAPVLLKNCKLITPFESVTTLYGLPLPHEFDPTPLLAPFFIIYYALCLTDGGYGATLALIMGAIIWKKKLSIEGSPLIWLLLYSGIVSFFVGIPFGGWFGLTPNQVPEVLTREVAGGGRLFRGQIWNLSEQSGINFLQYLALGLGVTHIFFGMFLSGYHKWVHGNKIAALWQDFTPHLVLALVIGILAAPVPWKRPIELAFYVSIGLLIWGKGYGNKWFVRPLMGFLGVANMMIGLLSNSLSYLRILALGLVTGAIAMAVDQVAVEMGRLFPWMIVRIPVVILIALMGHTVSIALNALGSFIHSGRLQFIEFFSQFFEGGGRPFLPFQRQTTAHSVS